jgi:hypothetical protein
MNRWVRPVVTAAVAAVVLAPGVIPSLADDFPLSTYPMFAVDRGPTSVIPTAVGWTEAGSRVRLSPYLLAGTSEPIHAVRTARVEVAGGRSADWCDEIARRAATRPPRQHDRVVSIEVVTETHDALATVTAGAEPIRVAVHASCSVVTP